MTASRLKRLGKLEQASEERIREEVQELVSRAMDALTPELLGAIGREVETRDTPEYDAALSRLLEWGKSVPEIRDAPELGGAALAWWKSMEETDTLRPVPRASMEAVEGMERYAAQWREVAERPDCPEQEAARGQAASWTWWAALARVSRE